LCEVEVYGGMYMCQTCTHRYSLILLHSIMQNLTFNMCFFLSYLFPLNNVGLPGISCGLIAFV